MTKKQWRQTFSKRILQRLGELSMTQRDLARKLGVRDCTVTRYLYSERIPNAVIAANIARALGRSSAWLIDVGEEVK